MTEKKQKRLEDHGAGLMQACRWIGEALVGDPDEVLEEMASYGDPSKRAAAPPAPVPRVARATAPRPAPRRTPEVVDAEFDEDDE